MEDGLKDFIRQDRRDFVNVPLDIEEFNDVPMIQFRSWLETAINNGVREPYAMCLSTLDREGYPSSRIVFLRELSDEGLIFYTNYSSRKGKELSAHPKAAMNFHWEAQDRQVHLKGEVEKVSKGISDAYFASRPRESQIGAWASHQSDEMVDRAELMDRVAQYEKEFEGKDVPRPAHWGGFMLRAMEWEFWQGSPSRLHDRILYKREEGDWKRTRLNP
jgi:pyridoxamine 5'-phosphate oxidase